MPPKMHTSTLGIDLHYYTSDSNYDSQGGHYEEMGKGRRYTNVLATLYSHYQLSHRMNIIGSLGVASAQSTNTDANRDHMGFTEVMGGGQIQLVKQPFSLIGEAFVAFPLNRFENDTDDVLTGEGAMVVQTGAWISKEVSPYTFHFYLAYKYQDGGRASLLPWSVGLSQYGSSWIYSLEIGGFNVLQDDENLNNFAKREDVVRRVNGGSLKYNSVNPEVLELTGKVGYRLSQNTSLILGLSSTINGKNYGAGNTVIANWEWCPGMKKRTHEIHPIHEQDPELEEFHHGDNEVLKEIKKIEEFDVNPGEYNRKLFKKRTPRKKK